MRDAEAVIRADANPQTMEAVRLAKRGGTSANGHG
jgi:hypothetical protein